jgi:hypothetical protein
MSTTNIITLDSDDLVLDDTHDQDRDDVLKKNMLWAISAGEEDNYIELTMFEWTKLTAPLLMMLIEDLAGHARRLSQ